MPYNLCLYNNILFIFKYFHEQQNPSDVKKIHDFYIVYPMLCPIHFIRLVVHFFLYML